MIRHHAKTFLIRSFTRLAKITQRLESAVELAYKCLNFSLFSDLCKFHFCEVMSLSYPLMACWRFAVDQQSASSHRSKYCCDDPSKCFHHQLKNVTVIVHNGRDNLPVTIIVLPHNQKKCSKVIRYDVSDCSVDTLRVIQQMLMQAGDVETNPGPGKSDY